MWEWGYPFIFFVGNIIDSREWKGTKNKRRNKIRVGKRSTLRAREADCAGKSCVAGQGGWVEVGDI